MKQRGPLLLLETLLPAMVTKLIGKSCPHEEEEALLMKSIVDVLLAGVEAVPDPSNLPRYIEVVLRTITCIICNQSSGAGVLTGELTNVCGLGAARLAKSDSDAFKAALGSLSDEEKASLQLSMKTAVLSASSRNGASVGSASNNTKKIDLAKYKRG